MTAMNLAELFPDEDFRFHMGVERSHMADFFRPTPAHEALLAERRRWLRAEPERYAAFLPEGAALLNDCGALVQNAGAFSAREHLRWSSLADPAVRCRALGEILEPDFLLLKPDASGVFRLLGGCVVFPSAWSLDEKIGKPIDSIHAPVPSLNRQLGRSIHGFLGKVTPGHAWLRHNWGLSNSPELNQHPTRALPRLDASVHVDDVWLRVERQAFVALPASGGILFGIRIEMHPLRKVANNAIAAPRLARALKTMPEETAAYKGLAAARERIASLLGPAG
jgi:hypothetical protein